MSDADTNTRSEVIAGLVPSAPRRMFGTAVLYGLGALLFYLVITQPPEGLHLVFLLVLIGAVSIYGGYKMWDVTGHMIELTEEELRLSDGRVIFRMDDVVKVDRSFFAFKPSNGFLVTLKTPYPRQWAPGLWWRFGKRVGVGGLTSGAEGKLMADTLTAMIATRDGIVDLDGIR
ncbi:hypothetical protein SAMN05444273_101630 [Litoreibacter ascidiaceicola]|uniref:PH domain-containing protein n=1 Tax=Litoreibacter ascidiaceicola TaxID=1486859 RepID=A0A1M4U2A5_9RHOB|nr:hypothetical protein [Litoreibacter ascidiaceicola]SHE50838.1 hypothetical protein SAMN05444273_101630 [Litoreibacter ascidiaceicola]